MIKYLQPDKMMKEKMDETKTFEEDLDEQLEKDSNYNNRYDWLDQFRGMCTLIYIIAVIAFPLSGDIAKGIYPIYPTYLNHGWSISFTYFGDIPSTIPVPITLIDLGQTVLVFLLGFMQAHAFKKRILYRTKRDAWMHTLNRFSLLLTLSVILEDMFLMQGLFIAIFEGVFAILAWSTLIAGIIVNFIDNPKKRFFIAIGIMIIHFICYEIPSLRSLTIGKEWWVMSIPWKMINLTAVSIIGTVAHDHLFTNELDFQEKNFKVYILPTIFIFLVLNFLLDFIQFSNPVVANTPLILLGMAWALFGLFIYYVFEQWQFKIPFFSDFGRNMFLFFIISPILDWVWIAVIQNWLWVNDWLDLVLVGIFPLSALGILAKFFSKKKILVKM